MLRIIGAILCWVLITGGLWFYMNNRSEPQRIEGEVIEKAEGEYRIELTTSFAAVPDPFALDVGDSPPASLELLINGNNVISVDRDMSAGEELTAEAPVGLVKGVNEFFVSASPPLESVRKAHAVRVRLYYGAELVAERTLWSEPGMKLAATFRVDLSEEASHE